MRLEYENEGHHTNSISLHDPNTPLRESVANHPDLSHRWRRVDQVKIQPQSGIHWRPRHEAVGQK